MRMRSVPCVLNAANEVAVYGFLDEKISFPDIHAIITQTIDAHKINAADNLELLLEADRWARDYAQKLVEKRSVIV